MEILHADSALYAALVDGKVAVKLGPGSWSPADAGLPLADGCADWALVTCGNEFAVRALHVSPLQFCRRQLWRWASLHGADLGTLGRCPVAMHHT